MANNGNKFNEAHIELSHSCAKKLWGYGSDLSDYDLSLFLHRRSNADMIEHRATLADRRPWTSGISAGVPLESEIVSGVWRTVPARVGLYTPRKIVGLYSSRIAGYFEIDADDFRILEECINSGPNIDRVIRVNNFETSVLNFIEELNFLGNANTDSPGRVVFEIIRVFGDSTEIERRFDRKRFRIPERLALALISLQTIDPKTIQKLLI